ncbi:MAG: exonuclease SbcCD subunit D [Brotaphodocola sp.]
MKLIHLSDLHIGKRVNEFSMLEDQKYILAQILSVIQTEQADGVILAGDIYDKTVPPAEAVQVFDDFLTNIAEMNCPVFIISGNHDSAERLAFGANLMSGRGVYFSPVYNGDVRKIVLKDAFGEVVIHLLPFVRPSVVRHALDMEIGTYQEAVRAAIAHMKLDSQQRNVLVAHQFVTGAARCESEEVSVGGLDQVDASLFDAFDYVALGHIHSPQHVGRQEVRYCGTPLKYSFSEAEQEKSVTVLELGEKGDTVIRTVPLRPLRDMRKIRGTYLEVTARSFYESTNTEDYVQVTLTDEEDVPDGLQKLRVIYPNLMRLEYDNKRTRENRAVEAAAAVEEKSELELFEEFFELQNNQMMSEEQTRFIKQMIQNLQTN